MTPDVVIRVEWGDVWHEYRKRNIKTEEQFKFYLYNGMTELMTIVEGEP